MKTKLRETKTILKEKKIQLSVVLTKLWGVGIKLVEALTPSIKMITKLPAPKIT
jgi:hypothetical protein